MSDGPKDPRKQIREIVANARTLSDGSAAQSVDASGSVAAAEAAAPEFSDEALALDFAAEHVDRLRYVQTFGRWLLWNGNKWAIDESLAGLDEARKTCRRAARRCNNAKASKELASAKTVAAVERLAKADRRLAATPEMFDRESWLLNTPGGVIDLRDGTRRPSCGADLMTKSTSVAPAGDCPRWLKFLREITRGDEALIEYLRRVAGYALSGQTTEHALFFAFGTGANGKSVFVNALAGILGDYHRTAPIEAFVASSGDRHPTELAGLRGARLVTAIETEEGRRWAEAKIKALTGGDRIAARFMRQDFFEFDPQFKLLIAGNHRPGLRSVDESIRRRFHLIPFDVTIPAEDRDPALSDKLRDEWPGILSWALAGCQSWQETGLSVCEKVRAATDDYLSAEDSIAGWLDECCELNPQGFLRSAELFRSWASWAERAGEPAGSGKRLSQALETRGFAPKRANGARGFGGLQFRISPSASDDGWAP